MQPTENKEIFTYRPNTLFDRSFLILKDGDPVGDYVVLDETEDPALSELKMMNLVSKLNGSQELLMLGDRTKSRLLFNCMDDGNARASRQVMFYTYDGTGVSEGNAVLTIDSKLMPTKGDLSWVCAASSCIVDLDRTFDEAARPEASAAKEPQADASAPSTKPSAKPDDRPFHM